MRIGGQFTLYLLHLRSGSVPASITVGRKLPAGTVIGTVGNSGTSVEPHLHLGVTWDPDAWSVPFEFANLYEKRNTSESARFHSFLRPETGTWISEDCF